MSTQPDHYSSSTGKLTVSFDKGTICITGTHPLRIPYTKYDERSHILRAQALHYKEIIEYLQNSNLDFIDNVPLFPPFTPVRMQNIQLRSYQNSAIDNWKKSWMRGCVILPTGAGKTTIGIKAIDQINAPTLVVVPTIDLIEQWKHNIQSHLVSNNNSSSNNNTYNKTKNSQRIRVGQLGGGQDDIQPITIATYDSAYLRASTIGNQFKLVIFDEVHHLPAPGYRGIAEQLIAPYRLGLTATIKREDDLDELIPQLTGGVVFQMGPQELSTQKHLAEYTIDRRQVSLTPTEQQQYDLNYTKFLTHFKKLGFKIPSLHNLKRLIMISNQNKTARDAMLARNKANEIALNSQAKIHELQTILQEHPRAKTIIFTQNNKMVYQISDKFLIPFITYKTGKDERKDVLQGFKTSRYQAVVTSRVLDEGVDVPDAELGIIVSGTGSGRELIQRLGRILRPKQDGRKAKLIELVSKHTRETNVSAKRITALRKNSSAKKNLLQQKNTPKAKPSSPSSSPSPSNNSKGGNST